VDEVLYYKAWVNELQSKIDRLERDVRKLENQLDVAKESVADSLSYYFEQIASAVSEAQEEIQEYMS